LIITTSLEGFLKAYLAAAFIARSSQGVPLTILGLNPTCTPISHLNQVSKKKKYERHIFGFVAILAVLSISQSCIKNVEDKSGFKCFPRKIKNIFTTLDKKKEFGVYQGL
jgi:hypothetical protein